MLPFAYGTYCYLRRKTCIPSLSIINYRFFQNRLSVISLNDRGIKQCPFMMCGAGVAQRSCNGPACDDRGFDSLRELL